MKTFALASLALLLILSPALAEPETEQEGPQAPCVPSANDGAGSDRSGGQWGVQIASSFNKQETIDEFAKAKDDYADVLQGYSPTIVEVCDLSMGTDLRYSARIPMESRDAPDGLCKKLQDAGGACIVLKD